MRKRIVSGLWLAVVAMLVAGACAPAASPAVAPAPAAPPQAALVVSPEAAAWAGVVAAAKKEGKLNLYAYSFTGDVGLTVAKAFRNRYGIDADVIAGRGAEFLERLKVERRMGQVVADVVESSYTHTLNMKKEGLTLSASDLPAVEGKGVWTLHPRSWDPEGHTLGYTYYLHGVQINTRSVKPGEEPTSWYDLLLPRWKGKILANDPTISVSLYNSILPMLEAGALSKDYVARLGEQKLRLERSAVQVAEALSRGEYPLSIASPSSAARYMAEGAPIRMVPLKEGHAAGGLVVTLVKGAPHPNVARLFVNWLLSQEGQSIVLKPMAATPVRNDAPDYLPEAGQVKNVKIIPDNPEIANKVADAFRQKLWVELIKR